MYRINKTQEKYTLNANIKVGHCNERTEERRDSKHHLQRYLFERAQRHGKSIAFISMVYRA